VGESGPDVLRTRVPSQQSAIRPPILMVASYDQLKHQNSEWFFRQPQPEAVVPTECVRPVLGRNFSRWFPL
jgi:hypothetical protein